VPVDLIIIRDTFTLAHKLNLKEPPSDWLALPSPNETAFIEEVLNGDAVFIMADSWRETVQEGEIGENAGVKVSKQRRNTTCIDLDRPWSHLSEARRLLPPLIHFPVEHLEGGEDRN
jgi:hypothetical protein